MERQQFPSVIELISGKFLRHSPEFHYWRIKDREEKLGEFPDSLNLYDDLAVSYSKIGDDKKAIEIILKKETIQPGQYETYANLGTFYLHDGQFQKGIEYIDKAIEINPNAHFGREIYQRHLAQYVITKMENGKISLPLDHTFFKYPDYYLRPDKSENFYAFLLNKYKSKLDSIEREKTWKLPKEVLEKAVIGIMGMMKFGNYNSPILLEVLGDLLVNVGDYDGARQLAARAYFKASYEVDNIKAKEIYNKRIVFVLYHQYTRRQGKKFTLFELEELLKEEIEDGDNFYQQIRNDEINWISSGKNPEQEFATKYYEEPKIPERIQHGKGGRKDIEDKYIRDTTIGKIVDYRPVPKQDIRLDSTQKNVIDSIFDRKLEKEERTIKPADHDQQEITTDKPTNYLIIVLTLIAGLVGTTIWIVKKKRKKRGTTSGIGNGG
jgi:tetratricopeptide (TPR) repeat protein